MSKDDQLRAYINMMAATNEQTPSNYPFDLNANPIHAYNNTLTFFTYVVLEVDPLVSEPTIYNCTYHICISKDMNNPYLHHYLDVPAHFLYPSYTEENINCSIEGLTNIVEIPPLLIWVEFDRRQNIVDIGLSTHNYPISNVTGTYNDQDNDMDLRYYTINEIVAISNQV